jgi:hypothetical protein
MKIVVLGVQIGPHLGKTFLHVHKFVSEKKSSPKPAGSFQLNVMQIIHA